MGVQICIRLSCVDWVELRELVSVLTEIQSNRCGTVSTGCLKKQIVGRFELCELVSVVKCNRNSEQQVPVSKGRVKNVWWFDLRELGSVA